MQSFGYVERAWASLAFELSATSDQMAKLRPAFQKAWNRRKEATKKLRDEKTRDAAVAEFQKIKQDVDAQLKVVLTKAQMTKWTTLQQQQAAQWGQRGGGGARGGQGGGGAR